jgi:hypothetical protein
MSKSHKQHHAVCVAQHDGAMQVKEIREVHRVVTRRDGAQYLRLVGQSVQQSGGVHHQVNT